MIIVYIPFYVLLAQVSMALVSLVYSVHELATSVWRYEGKQLLASKQ